MTSHMNIPYFHNIRFGNKRLFRDTVPALMHAFINEPGILENIPKVSDGLDMIIICSSYEAIVLYTRFFKECFELI